MVANYDVAEVMGLMPDRRAEPPGWYGPEVGERLFRMMVSQSPRLGAGMLWGSGLQWLCRREAVPRQVAQGLYDLPQVRVHMGLWQGGCVAEFCPLHTFLWFKVPELPGCV